LKTNILIKKIQHKKLLSPTHLDVLKINVAIRRTKLSQVMYKVNRQ